MIDSVAIVWGHALEPRSRTVAVSSKDELRVLAEAAARLRRVPSAERQAHPLVRLIDAHERLQAERLQAKNAPVPPPLELDIRLLAKRHGSRKGEIRTLDYEHAAKPYGHWRLEQIELLYRPGRLELRASLPKLLFGRNDIVLNERGTHEALLRLAVLGSEATGIELDLRDAHAIRLDYAYQWPVPSVAGVLEHMKASFNPKRRLRTENVSPYGGRSLVYGYRGKHVLRFYDKVAEVAERRGEVVVETDDLVGLTEPGGPERTPDTLLRYEVQDRRRPRLQLVHERGYCADAIRAELAQPIGELGRASVIDLGLLLDREDTRGVAVALAALHLAEHDELWPQLRRHLPASTYYRWRKRSRAAAEALNDWRPVIPVDAFTPEQSLWERLSPTREDLGKAAGQ